MHEDLYHQYLNGKICLENIPVNKLTWKILGRAAIKEPDKYINFIFDLCENKKLSIDIIKLVEFLPSDYLTQDIYNRVFRINPKKNFLSIPKKYRTDEMISEYNSFNENIKTDKLSPRERKQNMYNLLYKEDPMKNFNIIPDEYKTQEMCNSFFYLDPLNHFKMIPNRFITKEICDEFLKIHPFRHFDLIPNRFKMGVSVQNNILEQNSGVSKQLIYNEIFRKNPMVNFMYIPEEYRTQEMYERIVYLSNDITILRDIPPKFINNRIYEIIFWKNPKNNFTIIPNKFKTREMCDIVLKINFDSFFCSVPDEFKTQEDCNRFFDIDPVNNIGKIPIIYRTKDMLFKIIELNENLFGNFSFPENVMTTETFELLFDKIDPYMVFQIVPIQCVSQTMCDRLYDIDHKRALKIIPEKFLTKRMYKYIIDNICEFGEFKYIFNKINNQEIFDMLFDKDYKKYFKFIPKEFRSKRMYLELLKRNVNKYSKIIPEELYGDDIYNVVFSELQKLITQNMTISNPSQLCLKVIDNYPFLIKVLKQQVRDKVIMNDIFSLVEQNGTLEYIAKKYNVSIYYVKKLVEKIKDVNIVSYNIIKRKLDDNKNLYISNMINTIFNLGEIISSLGEMVDKKFSSEQKIMFAYLFYKNCSYTLDEIYAFDYKKYCHQYLDNINFLFVDCLKYDKFFDNVCGNDELDKIEVNNNWLKRYNRNSFFCIKDGIPSIEYKFGKDEKILTFDIESFVTDRLSSEGIPLNSYIVQCAFREYFNGSLDEFITNIKKYDYLGKKLKKRIKKI